MELKQIAYILTDFDEKFGIPRQSGRVPELIGRIVFLPEYAVKEAVRGIEDFTHLWLIFDFDKAHRDTFTPTVRPPRLGGNKKMGVFATRSPYRPNPIGLSSVKLIKVDYDTKYGLSLLVSGVDLLNNTPIYDIKPYLPSSDCHVDAKGGFADEFTDYALNVDFNDDLLKIIPKDKQCALIKCLQDDPRPSYQTDDRVYTMKYINYDVKFSVYGDTLKVIDVKIL
ncbi:MAG: tRNA (N6-threonylcarbamoyladenosine(37)-N6)-methyltransferase TrmO [Clostridia bacterium]|nr:tRNA (N6-threonylcarbamoyladenosine(37)-N6)-methyltransferase TrmO [Clostridia bacterium]